VTAKKAHLSDTNPGQHSGFALTQARGVNLPLSKKPRERCEFHFTIDAGDNQSGSIKETEIPGGLHYIVHDTESFKRYEDLPNDACSLNNDRMSGQRTGGSND
jgi:hypothetical protein